MKRALELSLPTRVALVLIGGLIALQALALSTVLWSRAQDTGAASWPLPDRLASLVELLETLDHDDRALALRAMNGGAEKILVLNDFPEGLSVPSPPVRLGPQFAGPYKRRLAGREVRILMRVDGEGATNPLSRDVRGWLVRGGEPDPAQFAFAVRMTTGEVLLFDPGAGARRQAFSTLLLIVNLVAAALVTFIVLRLLLSLMRPLNAIASRAQDFAGDLGAAPMAEQGPREARAVAAAFNAMRAETLSLIASRTRMLASIAHDLKTYLARLRLRVALIEDRVQRDKADADIAELTSLIEDSLLVARGESEQADHSEIDLAHAIAAILDSRSDARLAVVAAPTPCTVRISTQALRRILDNLIDNALAYAGSAEIVWRREGDKALVEVSDRGPGLGDTPPEALFEPFVRGEASRSRTTGGSGLGLSIARTLARQSQGDVTLHARDGGGLIARVTLCAGQEAPSDPTS